MFQKYNNVSRNNSKYPFLFITIFIVVKTTGELSGSLPKFLFITIFIVVRDIF